MTDTDTDTAKKPSVRRVVKGLLADYGTMTDDLLVATVHAETDAAAWMIRSTIKRLEKQGEIYSPDHGRTWKVTHA